MKKALALLLALVMVLSLAACGGGNDSPKSPTETTAPTLDIENAIAETPTHIYDDALENQARAIDGWKPAWCTPCRFQASLS